MHEVGRRYLENPVRIPLVHLEAFYCHREPQVFSVAHVREPAMIVDSSDVYESLLKNIRGGYDSVGFTDLEEKPQTPLSEFDIVA